MERFCRDLHQENDDGASEKTILVFHRFLNKYQKKTENFWRPKKLAMRASLWCILRHEERLGIPIAQAGAKWCISKKRDTPLFPGLGDRQQLQSHGFGR